MSNSVNLDLARFKYFPLFSKPTQRDGESKTEEISKSTINTNLESPRKRMREDSGVSLRSKAPRIRITQSVSEVIRPGENQKSCLRTVSSHERVSMNHSYSAQPLSNDQASPVTPKVELKKFRPLSIQSIQHAIQVIKDKELGKPISDARLVYAQQTVREFTMYNKSLLERQEDALKLLEQKENEKIAWACAAERIGSIKEKQRKRIENFKQGMTENEEKFPPERKVTIVTLTEEIIRKQRLCEQREDSRMRNLVGAILQLMETD